MTLLLGKPGNDNEPLRPEVDDLEIAQFGAYEFVPLPFFYTGLSWGPNGIDNYPNYLEDGMILSRVNPARYTEPQLAALNIQSPDGFYDFAANADDLPTYMVFTNQIGFRVSGLENIVHDYVNKTDDPWIPKFAGSPLKPVFDAAYEPGTMGSYNVTGVIGSGEAWAGARLFQELDLTNIDPGDYLTAYKGKFKKVVGSEKKLAQVEYKFTKNARTKVRFRFNFAV